MFELCYAWWLSVCVVSLNLFRAFGTDASTVREVLSGHRCVPGLWLDTYTSDPSDCVRVIAELDACSTEQFYHATDGDGRCGCVLSAPLSFMPRMDINCSVVTDKRYAHSGAVKDSVSRIYEVVSQMGAATTQHYSFQEKFIATDRKWHLPGPVVDEQCPSFESCCLTNDHPWCKEYAGSLRGKCCSSVLLKLAQRQQDSNWKDAGRLKALKSGIAEPEIDRRTPMHWVYDHPGTDPRLVACVRGGANGSSPNLHGYGLAVDNNMKNNFIRAAECVARLPQVDVVLDLFLGGGANSARAVANAILCRFRGNLGSSSKLVELAHRRPPEVFAFEDDGDSFEIGVRTLQHKLVAPLRPRALEVISNADTLAFQEELIKTRKINPIPTSETEVRQSANRHPLKVWVLFGRPIRDDALKLPDKAYPALSQYRQLWGPLEVLCQQRKPIDFVIIDGSARATLKHEWLTIEQACRPRFVLIHNINTPGPNSWIFTRLLFGVDERWTLQLRGYYTVDKEHWAGVAEIYRWRAWALFFRDSSSGAS